MGFIKSLRKEKQSREDVTKKLYDNYDSLYNVYHTLYRAYSRLWDNYLELYNAYSRLANAPNLPESYSGDSLDSNGIKCRSEQA